jgi:predicted ATPase
MVFLDRSAHCLVNWGGFMKGSIVNIETIVLANKYFRQVLYTARIDKVHHFTPLRGKIYGKKW